LDDDLVVHLVKVLDENDGDPDLEPFVRMVPHLRYHSSRHRPAVVDLEEGFVAL
jgi:hypothetical protein